MRSPAASVSSRAKLVEAATRMHEQHLSCLVICEKDRPAGILSERDLVRAVAESHRRPFDRDTPVATYMSTPVVTVQADASVEEGLALLQRHRVRRLPVVDSEGRLLGLVTESDLRRAESRLLREDREQLERRVSERAAELARAVARLRELSLEDGLLGIGNRRAMELELERMHQLASTHGRSYSLLLFDVDRFKSFNDRYGHGAGDRALQQVAACFRKLLRRSDVVFRYGGEEILVLLPETAPDGARRTAERLRAGVLELGIPHEDSPSGRLTVSCGVTSFPEGPAQAPASWRAVAERADRALYRAKRLGRNRVVTA